MRSGIGILLPGLRASEDFEIGATMGESAYARIVSGNTKDTVQDGLRGVKKKDAEGSKLTLFQLNRFSKGDS